jgi:hypothetical protein
MEFSIGIVRHSLDPTRHLTGRRVEPARPETRTARATTDAIGGLMESVRRRLLSIGENYPPYLPLPPEPTARLNEEAARATGLEVRRALHRVAPKSLAAAHAELRRLDGGSS